VRTTAEQKDIAEVIIDLPVLETNKPFYYSVPSDLKGKITIGTIVVVPFHGREVIGFVTDFPKKTVEKHLKSIISVLEEPPVFGEKTRELCKWISERYFGTFSSALRLIIPPGRVRKIKELIELADESESGVFGNMLIDTLRPELKSVVDVISCAGGVIESKALKRHMGPRATRLINTLENSGIVKRRFVLSEPSASVCFESYVKLAVPEEEINNLRLGKRQEELIRKLIAAGGEAPKKFLTGRSSSASSSLKSLEKRGIVTFSEAEVKRKPHYPVFIKQQATPALNLHQSHAFRGICQAIESQKHRVFLLEGVTGSGKTEVYLRSIEKVLNNGRTAIVLVPEISLTPQTVERFESRFPGKIAVLHSALRIGERFDEWRSIRDGKKSVVIGARSAVFAPLENIGLFVIDEEHEPSYKNDSSPRYHAREVAIKRAALSNAVVILGSATPSLESSYKARAGIFTHLTLPERIDGKPFPDVEVIDMRQVGGAGGVPIISPRLLDALSKTLIAGEQAILFLNRRGFSNFLQCRACGYIPSCEDCEVSLCYHFKGNLLMCHHCSRTVPSYDTCPSCGTAKNLKGYGAGTERVEEEIRKHLGDVSIVRMDTDTTRGKNAHWRLLEVFKSGRAPILIGTQMIAKGLDIPSVTLVGVINADTALSLPDFRASERTYQLLTQVSGRAGRGLRPGQVIIQTFNPEHPVIKAVANGSVSFLESEIKKRREALYPPFSELINIVVSSTDMSTAAVCSERLKKVLQTDLKSRGLTILGPAPAPLTKIKKNYRWHILIKCPEIEKVSQSIRNSMARFRDYSRSFSLPSQFKISIDADPVSLL